MLRELRITGLGVVEELALELHPGLNVLTGETGAGKTMVTVGLALALGGRASASLVRTGAKAARVEALFDASPATDAAGWSEDGDLILARTVGADGKGTARAGGQSVPVSTLASIGDALVEVHGQHESTRLLSPAAQAAFLDRYAGGEHVAALAALGAEVSALRVARDERDRLAALERDRERQLDVLSFQIRELEAAEVRAGELLELEGEAARLTHAERLLERATDAESSILADDAAADGLARAARVLETAAEVDPAVSQLAERAREVAALAADLGMDVRGYRESLGLDPGRLDVVRERIAALRGLLRKYGGTEEELLAFLDGARGDLESLAGAGDRAAALTAEIARLETRVAEAAAVVTAGRTSASAPLAAAVQSELRELGMPDARIEIALTPLPEIAASGAERPEISFSAGENQPMLPLAKVASGGELSRAMLALRSVLVDLDDVPTLVFDEVDAGIGGRAGVAVGRRLARLAATRQVLVVTHLPQIAAFADRHIRVEKRAGTASVGALDDGGRIEELTRMLSGLPGSEAAATHAEELIAEAAKAKRSVAGTAR
mgnify:CR=1 FL=1